MTKTPRILPQSERRCYFHKAKAVCYEQGEKRTKRAPRDNKYDHLTWRQGEGPHTFSVSGHSKYCKLPGLKVSELCHCKVRASLDNA